MISLLPVPPRQPSFRPSHPPKDPSHCPSFFIALPAPALSRGGLPTSPICSRTPITLSRGSRAFSSYTSRVTVTYSCGFLSPCYLSPLLDLRTIVLVGFLFCFILFLFCFILFCLFLPRYTLSLPESLNTADDQQIYIERTNIDTTIDTHIKYLLLPPE